VPELDFVTPFTLRSNAKADSPVQIRAFLTWFDTFFSPDSSPSGQAPLDQDTQYVKYENDAFKRDVSVDGSKNAREVSFTTGPRGKATHWKQVAFILQEPVSLKSGVWNESVSAKTEANLIRRLQMNGLKGLSTAGRAEVVTPESSMSSCTGRSSVTRKGKVLSDMMYSECVDM
jgi:hypothetical protein